MDGLAYLAGQPVDDHRHRVAGVIDEQLVAAHMGLAHRDRELAFLANILNKVALSVHARRDEKPWAEDRQANMKKDLREVYSAPNRASAEVAIDVFAEKYGAKYDKAVECLTKDRDALLAFYDFPAEHWDHLRTTNPIESVFATVRHRTVRTKGSLSSTTAKLMVFKLLCAAAKTWRRLKGTNQLPKVIAGVKFENGIEVIELPANHAA